MPPVPAYEESSAEMRGCVSELLRREKAGEISAKDLLELDRYLQIEHLMRLEKARAKQLIRE